MYRGVTCVNGVSRSGGSHTILRLVSSLVAKRRNSTVAAAQEVPEEWGSAKPYEQMPGPKPLPLIGNFWRFIPYIGDITYDDIIKQNEYFHKKFGVIAKLSGLPGRSDVLFIFDPDEIQKVYRNEGQWPLRETIQSIRYYRTVTRKDIFEGGPVGTASQGEEWQKYRTKANPILMQPRATKLYVAPIDAVANDFINRIRILRDDKLEMPADFNNELFKWAIESIVYITLDTRLGCLQGNLEPDSEPQRIIKSTHTILDSLFKLDILPSLWKYISTPAWRRFVRASDTFTELALKYINQAKERLKAMPENSDREMTILEKMLARDPNPKTAMVVALDLMMAAVDTISYTVAINLYFLAKNPDKQQKLFEEIHRHLPDKGQPITLDILPELKYLKACGKESMRLRPVAVGNARTLPKDMVLHDYRVPKGTDVFLAHAYLSQQEKYFAQADKYIPERWLKSPEGDSPETKNTHPFVFMPFGFGPRMCLGRRFAELEMDILITRIIRNFRIEFNYEMKFKTRLLQIPVSPLKFKFVDRE